MLGEHAHVTLVSAKHSTLLGAGEALLLVVTWSFSLLLYPVEPQVSSSRPGRWWLITGRTQPFS